MPTSSWLFRPTLLPLVACRFGCVARAGMPLTRCNDVMPCCLSTRRMSCSASSWTIVDGLGSLMIGRVVVSARSHFEAPFESLAERDPPSHPDRAILFPFFNLIGYSRLITRASLLTGLGGKFILSHAGVVTQQCQ
ncbi:hypothetical protein B0T16DRAFT_415371 [Cercophora newfieldiana]|uniref:Secreted protein n=1 Tax=Cercophora newfieldiana TaxID=92897 RepID=A0AA39Y0Z2_9PEZI|nr:hypothetical protein B0T16DRAFT_415371 [Cercophora newfieldiana]